MLAIYDLLRDGKELTSKEVKQVKKVAQKTLEALKKEKLNAINWHNSQEVQAQIRSTIRDNLFYLPPESYSDDEVEMKTIDIYNHIFTNYYDGGSSIYQQSAGMVS